MIGSGNMNWVAGGKHKHYGPDWPRIESIVQKRDHYTCQHCGIERQYRKPLHVHHIKPIRLFNGDFTTANQLENLITLCRSCHVKEDSRLRKLENLS